MGTWEEIIFSLLKNSCHNVCIIYKFKLYVNSVITVKHGYREHAYYELMHTAKWFSVPVTITCCKLDG